MTGDKTMFISLMRNYWSVTFGDNGTSKMIGKGTLSLENGATKVENVLCVKDLKHNLLNVCQMCYQGHTLTFDSHECEIRRSKLGKLVWRVVWNPSNVYIPKENGEHEFWQSSQNKQKPSCEGNS